MLKPAIPWSEEELIKSHDFLIFIAKALHPDLKSLRGISCVVKRRMPASPQIPGLATVTAPLSNSHKKELLEIFPEISLLRGDMSSGEINDFYKKYQLLKNRPPWTPVFNVATKRKLEKNRSDQYDLMGKHGQLLQKAMDTGEITGLNHDHIPQKYLGLGALISYSDALNYLRKKSIPHIEKPERNLKSTEFSCTPDPEKIPNEKPSQELNNKTTIKKSEKPRSKGRKKGYMDRMAYLIVTVQKLLEEPHANEVIFRKLMDMAKRNENELIQLDHATIGWAQISGKTPMRKLTLKSLGNRIRRQNIN